MATWIQRPTPDDLEPFGEYWVYRKSGHLGLAVWFPHTLRFALYHLGTQRIMFDLDQVERVLLYERPTPPDASPRNSAPTDADYTYRDRRNTAVRALNDLGEEPL